MFAADFDYRKRSASRDLWPGLDFEAQQSGGGLCSEPSGVRLVRAKLGMVGLSFPKGYLQKMTSSLGTGKQRQATHFLVAPVFGQVASNWPL